MNHDPNCAIVRAGDLRAWCDCQLGREIAKRNLDLIMYGMGVIRSDGTHVPLEDIYMVECREIEADIPPYEPSLVERLTQPQGWYFEDFIDHRVYASDDPFEAAGCIERLEEALRQVHHLLENCPDKQNVAVQIIKDALGGGK